MAKKITIIGAGSVGATTAFALLARGAASKIVLIDINTEKLQGEALDIKQATPFIDNCDIQAGDYPDAVGSDVVIITSGIGRKSGQTRLDLVQRNLRIIDEIAPEITKYAPDAIYILVANPVDILTYAFLKRTGLPKQQVLGTGTVLDTIRLRTRLAEIYNVNSQQVHAHVLGEHGDSSFVAWSAATIAGVHLDEYGGIASVTGEAPQQYSHEDVENYVRKSGAQIIAKKGCTVYGIAMSIVHIVKALGGNSETALTVSSLHEGEYGISDVCLSSLTLIGARGVNRILTQKLSDTEMQRLYASAESLRTVLRSAGL